MRLLLAPLLLLLACSGGGQITGPGNTKEPALDEDADGYGADVDCDDLDQTVHPDATEACDGIDNNCDGVSDEGLLTTWYLDADGDGYGDATQPDESCEQPDGFVADATDCDDRYAGVHPDAEDTCDGVDSDCDGNADEDSTSSWYPDVDGDSYGDASASPTLSCSAPDGYTTDNRDCDDADVQVRPGASDQCNGVDDDCDGELDEDARLTDWYEDADGDGYGDPLRLTSTCEAPPGYVRDDSDCDDLDDTINPDAIEHCDLADEDCDGDIDEDAVDGRTWYADRDGDTYGSNTSTRVACDQPNGYTVNASDCDDAAANVHPGAAETCDDVDEDCDGTVDDAPTDAGTWYRDSDGDGFGDATASLVSCDAPSGYVSSGTDCNDASTSIYPGASESCNDLDDDCDGTVDEGGAPALTWYLDADGDGYGSAGTTALSCDAPPGYVASSDDCNDGNASLNPGASELCDGIDNDCDGTVDQGAVNASTWYADADGDGYGNAGSTSRSCSTPGGYVSSASDCDDGSSASYPGAAELCDGVDNDCDGTVDDGASNLVYVAEDGDGDGFGAVGTTDWRCSGVDNELDCDDGNAAEPVAVDVINGLPWGDGSAGSPMVSIAAGVAAANECVVVYPGTYAEDIDFGGEDLIIEGLEGPDSTILSGSGGSGAVVTFANGESAAAELRGFTITGGSGHLETSSSSSSCGSGATCTNYYYTYCGGGVFVDGATPTLEDLIITDNTLPTAGVTSSGNDTYTTASYGGGLCMMGTSLTLSGLEISSNYADQGGGIYVDSASTLTLSQSEILGNAAVDGGGIEAAGSMTLTNVVSAFNAADADGAGLLMTAGTLVVVNVVYAGDTGTSVYLSGTTAAIARNVIIYDSSDFGLEVDSGATWSGSYNNLYGNLSGNYSGTVDLTGSNGNLSVEPMFTSYSDNGDVSDDDFHPATGSPMIDGGNPSAAYRDVDGTVNDLGAFGGPGGSW